MEQQTGLSEVLGPRNLIRLDICVFFSAYFYVLKCSSAMLMMDMGAKAQPAAKNEIPSTLDVQNCQFAIKQLRPFSPNHKYACQQQIGLMPTQGT